MMDAELTGVGIRRRVNIFDENYYIVVTPTSVECTVPHENRPDQIQTRMVVDKICEEITKTMGMMHEG
jgi:hypothetical protein